MNCLSNLRQMSLATAEALIQSPYMTPEGIQLLVKSANGEVIEALLDSSVFSERVSLYQAFLSSQPVLSIKVDAIFRSTLSDSLVYEALIQLRQLIQPNENWGLNREIASFPNIKDEDICWLLTRKNKFCFVTLLLNNPTITSSAPKLGLVLSMLDKESISLEMSILRAIDGDSNSDETIHELLRAYVDEPQSESQLNADEGGRPKI